MSLRFSLATPEGKSRYVRRLFARIADRYDLITVLLSYGLDRRWKRRLARMAGACSGARTLDLACGTGDIAFAMAGSGARVVGLDITYRMVHLARAKQARRVGREPSPASGRPPTWPVSFVVADMLALPFPDGSFSVMTTGYGIRNVPDLSGALREIHRVLEPGGLVLSLDFDRPAQPILRWLYLGYLEVVGSALGLLLHGDPDTYRYIPASLRRYPGAAGLERLMRNHGFRDAGYVRILGGLIAISTGSKAPANKLHS